MIDHFNGLRTLQRNTPDWTIVDIYVFDSFILIAELFSEDFTNVWKW